MTFVAELWKCIVVLVLSDTDTLCKYRVQQAKSFRFVGGCVFADSRSFQCVIGAYRLGMSILEY